ncbi:hypothetical protein [Aquihabitans sp. McL0605]|uniref:hypothetical protein n=1 Tax=Aquihabitans sp. McL0605 TaxID=3415671 RepID=UPI003CF3B8B1
MDGVVPPSPRSLARAVATAAAAVLLAAPLGACGLVGSDATATTTAAPTTTTEPPVAVSDPPTILDPGTEPLLALRLHFTEGQEATISFTSDVAVDQGTTAGTPTQGVDSPPINQTLTYTVGKVTSAGAQVTMRVTAVTVRSKGTGLTAKQVQALQQQLDPLVGIEGTGLVTPLGEFQDLAFDVPKGVDKATTARIQALDRQIMGLGPSLPAEPIGVGARWAVTATSDAGGAEIKTQTIYTATALTTAQVGYTATISTSAAPQDLELDGLPKGTTASLRSSALEGTSTGTLALTSPGFTLTTKVSGPQVIVLTSASGATTVTQEIRLAYSAATSAH